MKIWPFSNGRNGGRKFADLTEAERHTVAGKLSRLANGLFKVATFGKGFEAVKTPFSNQRRPSVIEYEGEDKQVSARDRHRLVNMQRDMMRNSPTRLAMDQQLRVHVVGACGGKLYASFPEGFEDASAQVSHYFNKVWFKRAEFTFRKDFNWLLKTVLTSTDITGNVMLVFDDGILTGGNGTGRIRGFEGDEIANIPKDEFARRFGEKYNQSCGFVYNEAGMFCGAFASTKHRGLQEFPADGYITFTMDPFDDDADPAWIMLGDMRRFNQGRAVSPLTAAITCLVDLHEICASERQGAKLNAQLVGQILQTATEDSTAPLPDFDEATDAVEGEPEVKSFTTKEMCAIGAHFDQMPEGMRVELLDTKRPNPNMPAYIEFLTGQVGGVRGLARVYSTLRAQTSYTAFRGEQVMTEPSFEEARQNLEREVCDWAARQVIRRGVKMGFITAALPDGWENMIAWNWPRMREVSEKDAQSALQLKLQNGVTSLKRELGPGEVEKIIAERAAEKKAFDDAGLVYPGEATASGQIKGESTTPEQDGGDPEKDEGNEKV